MQTVTEHREFIDRAPRHDGWTAERKARFFDSLAASGNVRLACRHAGMSPEAAYRFKRRDPHFARGWAAALVLANDHGRDTLADRAIDGVEEEVWHRGELVGTRRRFDSRLLLAHLARLEKAAADEAAQADAARFDELVARIVGESAHGVPFGDDPLLPLGREQAASDAASAAEEAARALQPEREAEVGRGEAGAGEPETEDACDEGAEEAVIAAYRAGHDRGARHWDNWVDNACTYIDWLTGWDAEPPVPGLPGNPLPEPLARELAAAARPCETPARSFPRTLCESSTSALARGLAAAGIVATPRSPRSARHASMR